MTKTEWFNRFNEEIYSINPSGSVEGMFNYLYNEFIEQEQKMIDNTIISFDLLKEKYKEYVTLWDYTYSSTEEKFIPKEKKKVDFWFFMQKGMYNNKFVIPKKNRDFYLFGNYSLNYIRERVNKFNKETLQGR